MFTKGELETTVKVTNVKIHDLISSPKPATAEYLRDIETLIKLRDAAEEQLERGEGI